MSAFGHYPILSLQLAKLVRHSTSAKANALSKFVAQKLLFCPSLTRLFVAYGAEGSGAGAACF